MKSLKVLACAACLMGTVSGVGFAKDVQTIAGSMVVPNNVNIVSASKTNTRDFVEKQMQQNPSIPSISTFKTTGYINIRFTFQYMVGHIHMFFTKEKSTLKKRILDSSNLNMF